jgi:hypothetical protein
MKDDKLKQLLKQAGTDKPADNFTELVMNIIEADAARETALKSVLKQHPAEGPSFDFTASVMRQVSAQRKPLVIQPIITKKAWYAIASVFMLFVLIAFAMSLKPVRVDLAGSSRISSIVDQLQIIPGPVVLGLVAIAMLLLGDYLIGQRRKAMLH